jgi:hypothetical protein
MSEFLTVIKKAYICSKYFLASYDILETTS